MSTIEQISEHIWIMHACHDTDRPILAAISGAKRTLLIDAGNSPTHAALFRQELQRHGVRQPEILVLTHWHWDHTFAMSEWNLPSIAQAETAHALRKLISQDWSDAAMEQLFEQQIINESTMANIKKEYGGNRNMIRIVEPDILFQESITIDLGGVTCEVNHVGGDHAIDSCYVYVKEDQTLFLGDALGPSVYGGPRSYTASSFLRLLRQAYAYNAQLFVESHGRPMDRAGFQKELGDWEQLAQFTEKYGQDRDRIAKEMSTYLQVPELPHEFSKALEWFMVGAAKE
ncbi:hydrolase glyoxylase [Brevibacillus choshinensis]|uniref:Hydrolase glyoxylase n=1 Tax=Brevibacillus choshinensis TaxID=54911 RepID=A0ABR5NE45_BRECH|nr:MBL fold metallo-hydrolase [Brevibacillus choshinensis]KQL49832.1 hydrolase glyoxylase [Brevibacillus choshinensis]